MASNDARLKSEAVAEWFWNKSKTGISKEGEILIRELNKATPTIKGVRYEEMGPHIYGVKVKHPKIVIETSDGTEQKMTLVKVGFTQTETSKYKDDTRINTLMDDIKRKIKKSWKIEAADCCVIFVLSIDALDTRVVFDVEAQVRSKVGIEVPKNIGKALQLPVHTEWVVTTEEFITKIRDKIELLKPEKQQEVKPEEEQSTGKGDQSTPKSSKQKRPPKTPASASNVKQELPEDVERLAKTTGDLTLEAINSPGGAEAAPAGKDETPSIKSRKPASVDTDAVFGLIFDKGKFDGVQRAFDAIKTYEEGEVDVVTIRTSNGENLKLMKSKKNQSG